MDSNEGEMIGLCFTWETGRSVTFNSGVQAVKDYRFKGDLIVKKRLKINPNNVATGMGSEDR